MTPEPERRQNTHEQRMQFLTKRVEWVKQYHHPYPDRRQPHVRPATDQDISPQRKVDKKTTTGV